MGATRTITSAGAAPSRRSVVASVAANNELRIGLLLIAALVFLPAVGGNNYWVFTFLLVTLYAGVAVLQNLLLSEAGQFSLGQGAIFGASAVAVGVVCGMHGYPFWAGALAGMLAGTLVGALFAGPALRVQGYYLAFVTLSAALVFPQLMVAFDRYTGGMNGVALYLPELSDPFVGGLSPLAVLIFLLTAGIFIFYVWVPKTRFGRLMIVAAKSPEAAQSLGASPGVIRAVAFLVTAFLTSIAGVLYVPLIGFVSPSAFKVDLSTLFFFAVIIGGQGRLLGPVLGILILYLLPNVLFADLAQYRLLSYGVAALVVTFLFPDGILGSFHVWVKRFWKKTTPPAVDYRYVIDQLSTVPAVPRATGQAIKVDGVTKRYDKLVAIDNVSLTLERGCIHGLVGPNGSGKTTLLNLLSGFSYPDSGTVHLAGNEMTRQPAWKRARQGLGRTFQAPRMFENLTLWDNVLVGSDALTQQASSGNLMKLLRGREREWSETQPDLLPHGQRRLLEVVRVVCSEADIILLDEPASGLSPQEREDLTELLKLLRDQMGRTIVLVEHDLSLVWNIADNIIVLDGGRVSAQGAPAELKGNKHVQALFTGTQEDA